MSDRRWGRVTVEGWIDDQQVVGMQQFHLYRDRDWAPSGMSEVRAIFYQRRDDGPLAVEFLPEPVQFKDGDALRLRDAVVWSRWCLGWRQSGIANGPILDDRWARDAVSLGAVRLVPEANGG